MLNKVGFYVEIDLVLGYISCSYRTCTFSIVTMGSMYGSWSGSTAYVGRLRNPSATYLW